MTDRNLNFDEIDHYTFVIDPLDINQEMCDLPGYISYWNSRLSDATENFLVAKNELATEVARTTLRHKATSVGANGKAPTVQEVDALVQNDIGVQSAQACLIQAEVDLKRIKGTVEAFIAKRDMLQSLGAKLRVEMMSDPVIRDMMAGQTHLGK